MPFGMPDATISTDPAVVSDTEASALSGTFFLPETGPAVIAGSASTIVALIVRSPERPVVESSTLATTEQVPVIGAGQLTGPVVAFMLIPAGALTGDMFHSQ